MFQGSEEFIPDSVASVLDNDGENNETATMSYMYAKQSFKKIIRRLKEDSSSIWYDH